MSNFDVTLFIIDIVVFVSYLTYIQLKYGWLSSISESYYKIKSKWLFSIFIWLIALPVIMLGVELHPLFFLAGALLSFVGAAPAFKDDRMTSIVHVIGATGGITIGLLALAILGKWICIIPVLCSIIYAKGTLDKHGTWIVEVVSYVAIIGGLLWMKL